MDPQCCPPALPLVTVPFKEACPLPCSDWWKWLKYDQDELMLWLFQRLLFSADHIDSENASGWKGPLEGCRRLLSTPDHAGGPGWPMLLCPRVLTLGSPGLAVTLGCAIPSSRAGLLVPLHCALPSLPCHGASGAHV